MPQYSMKQDLIRYNIFMSDYVYEYTKIKVDSVKNYVIAKKPY